MKPFMKYGGIVASVILIAFGIGSIYTGINGRSEVRDTLKREQIVGTPDMDKQIANKPINTGAEAKLFADGIRKHTLEATGGQVYSEMGRFLDSDRQADQRREGRCGRHEVRQASREPRPQHVDQLDRPVAPR